MTNFKPNQRVRVFHDYAHFSPYFDGIIQSVTTETSKYTQTLYVYRQGYAEVFAVQAAMCEVIDEEV